MIARFLTQLGWLAAAVAAAFASAGAVNCGFGTTPIDRALPLVAIVVVFLGWLARVTLTGSAIPFAVPLLIAIEATFADERLRLLAVGLVTAAAFIATVASLAARSDDRSLPLTETLAILIAATLLLRWLPFADLEPARELLLLLGLAAVAAAVARRTEAFGRVAPYELALLIALALVAPTHPGRAIAYPFVAALTLFATRDRADLPQAWQRRLPGWLVRVGGGGRATVARLGAIVIALIAGRWLLVLIVLPLVGASLAQRWNRRGESATTPAMAKVGARSAASLRLLVRSFAIVPSLAADLLRPDAEALGAMLIVVATLFVRPSLVPLYLLVAALLAARGRMRPNRASDLVTLIFAALVIAVFPWSGVAARAFPLPLSLAMLIILGLLPLAGRAIPLFAGAGALLLLTGVVSLEPLTGARVPAPNVPRRIDVIGASLAASHHLDLGVPPRVRVVTLRLFGANFSALKEGNRVGTIEARDVRGRAIVRSLAIGDVVDWGSLRREEAFPSRNPLPRDPLWEIHGYGATAWLGGISRTTIALPDDLASLRITAAPSLPAGARLQIDSVEMLGR